jgi:hypothetical protein
VSEPLPTYDPNEPARLQENDWDCSAESIEWCLYAWGRTPDDNWIEDSMIAAGVISPEIGCLDASGAGLADWLNDEYGEFGYLASNEPSVSFDDVAWEAGLKKHPLAIGGRGWYHWSGVRGYQPETDALLLANPAPGWQGVYDTITRSDWARLGTWSMVRLTHPASEGLGPPDPNLPLLDYSWWLEDGKVGTGLIEMMSEDGTLPAQEYSTWLPLGRHPAQIEECIAQDGTVYRWLLTGNRGFRYRPSDS